VSKAALLKAPISIMKLAAHLGLILQTGWRSLKLLEVDVRDPVVDQYLGVIEVELEVRIDEKDAV
jgi:hypothetical protein